MAAASTVTAPNAIDKTRTHTDEKEHKNLLAVTASGTVKRLLYFEATLDASSLVDGAGETLQITGANGVALGDIVLGASFGVDLVDMTVSAYVQAADVIEIRVQNESTATVDLSSTTVRVLVADVT